MRENGAVKQSEDRISLMSRTSIMSFHWKSKGLRRKYWQLGSHWWSLREGQSWRKVEREQKERRRERGVKF